MTAEDVNAVVQGRILDIHLDAGDLVLVLEVGNIRRPDGEALRDWKHWLLSEGECFPRFRAEPELAGAGVWLGRDVVVKARNDGGQWRIVAVDPEAEPPLPAPWAHMPAAERHTSFS